MKKVIIPTDFSPSARHCLEKVISFLAESSVAVEVILLNTYRVQHKNPVDVIRINDELKGRSKDALHEERKAAESLNKNPKIRFSTASHLGSLSNVLLQVLKSKDVDLVALSSDNPYLAEVIPTLKQEKCPLWIPTFGKNKDQYFETSESDLKTLTVG